MKPIPRNINHWAHRYEIAGSNDEDIAESLLGFSFLQSTNIRELGRVCALYCVTTDGFFCCDSIISAQPWELDL